MSIVCEAFHCTPDVALRQDMDTIYGVLEYRALAECDRNKDDVDKLTEEQVALWREMTAA